VDEDRVALAAVLVAQAPHRQQHVLPAHVGEVAAHGQAPLRVAGDVAGAAGALPLEDRLARPGPSALEVDLVLLGPPARQVLRTVGDQAARVEASEPLDQPVGNSAGGVHEQVVVDVVALAPGRDPAHLAHALGPQADAPVDPHGDHARHVVVVPCVGRPVRVHAGVEGPVGDVHAEGVEARQAAERAGPEPEPCEPLAEAPLGGLATDVQGNQRLGPQDVAVGLLGEDAGRATEDAVGGGGGLVEGHGRAALAAAHGPPLEAQAAGRRAGLLEGPLADLSAGARHGGAPAAVVAGEGVAGRVPGRGGSAVRAAELRLADALLRLLDGSGTARGGAARAVAGRAGRGAAGGLVGVGGALLGHALEFCRGPGVGLS